MTPTLEKMAKAAFERYFPGVEWEREGKVCREVWLAAMRAALTAIREPDDTVLTAFSEAMGMNEDIASWAMDRWVRDQAWPAAVDAILGDGK